MKVLRLLEGNNTELFHHTTQENINSILHDGGLRLSDLEFSGYEADTVRRAHGIDGKLYYLSMARHRGGQYEREQIREGSRTGLFFRFKINFMKVRRYGRIVPINYFDDVENRGEMEERLLSDHPLLPFGVIEYVDVLLPMRGVLSENQRSIIKTLRGVVSCRFYDTYEGYFSGRRAIEYDGGGEVNTSIEDDGLGGDIALVIRYLEGDRGEEVFNGLRKRYYHLSARRLKDGGDVEQRHKLRMLMRKNGYRSLVGFTTLFNDIMNYLDGGGK